VPNDALSLKSTEDAFKHFHFLLEGFFSINVPQKEKATGKLATY